MVNKEQIVNGVIRYIDNEIMPHLDTKGRWIMGTFAGLAASKIDEIEQKLHSNQMISALGIINEDGLVDIDALARSLQDSARKYGKLSLNLPFSGNLVFSDEDIELLRQYIIGGATNERRIDEYNQRPAGGGIPRP